LEDRIRLHIINRELDNTNPDGPFRVGRQQLNRERKRIIKRLGGRDPKWFAVRGKKGGMSHEEIKLYQTKKVIVGILDQLEGG